MQTSPDKLSKYVMNLCLKEIDFLNDEREASARIGKKPHIKLFLENRHVGTILDHIQNAIWTLSRWKANSAAWRAGISNRVEPSKPAGVSGARSEAPAQRLSPTIYLDVTATQRAKSVGGIGRVTSKLAEAAREMTYATSVYIENGALVPWCQTGDDAGSAISLRSGDIYVILDQFWFPFEEYIVQIERAKRVGAKVVVCVHDIIPALYPALIYRWFTQLFLQTFPRMLAACDQLITVSRASAHEISTYIRTDYPQYADKAVGWFHLGADAVSRVAAHGVRPAIQQLFHDKPAFLTVGTVLPHKGHLVALDAFERVWSDGIDVHYLIIGKVDPTMGSLAHAIRSHEEFGRHLHWLTDCSDDELRYAYMNARCLIQPSIAEGFGIPLVEASLYGLPVIASDIPVFRETGRDAFEYFDRCDSAMLARQIIGAIDGARADPNRLPLLTWKQSAADLCTLVRQAAPDSARCGRPDQDTGSDSEP